MLMGFENAFQNLQSTLATFGGEPFDATALTTALDACGTEEICISTAYVEQIGVLSDEIAEAGQARASEPSLADVLARLEALEGASEVAEVVEAEEPAEAVVAEEAEPAGVIEAEEIVVTEPTEEAQPRFLRGLDYRVYATTMTHPDRGGRYIQDSWLDPPSNVATVTDALQGIQIGYARVSTDQQDYALQVEALEREGCEKIFSEKLSGGKRKRPELDKMLDQLRKGDVVIVWKVDRLARSIKDAIEIVELIEKAGGQIKSLTEPFDTTTPMGDFLFKLNAIYAELERSMIRERTKAGLARAKEQGRVGGRPKALSEAQRGEVLRLKTVGRSVKEIADLFKVSVSTVKRV
ncbi:unnamed protein product [Cyprideis torosa]|uniref:Uncharacterized protein n=1 Tax=Cyprideis torosa TaxID=163714 RepID=A0A7R8WKN2_9CRUS|nr:unnamed protein product [Cyprideis torosa]CAG0897073.1 unnamed protein product [Cyprideis torosa]